MKRIALLITLLPSIAFAGALSVPVPPPTTLSNGISHPGHKLGLHIDDVAHEIAWRERLSRWADQYALWERLYGKRRPAINPEAFIKKCTNDISPQDVEMKPCVSDGVKAAPCVLKQEGVQYKKKSLKWANPAINIIPIDPEGNCKKTGNPMRYKVSTYSLPIYDHSLLPLFSNLRVKVVEFRSVIQYAKELGRSSPVMAKWLRENDLAIMQIHGWCNAFDHSIYQTTTGWSTMAKIRDKVPPCFEGYVDLFRDKIWLMTLFYFDRPFPFGLFVG